MAELTLRRPVVLKVIVTPAFKQELTQELERTAEQMRKQLEQLETEANLQVARLRTANLSQAMAFRDRWEEEKRRQQAAREEVLRQIEVVNGLEEGSEFIRGTLEGLVTVKVGDDLNELMSAEITVKDGQVISIQDGRQSG